MRRVPVADVTDAVAAIVEEAAYRLPQDYLKALEAARSREESPLGQQTLDFLLANARLAEAEGVATCQDTGMVVIFLEVGQDVIFVGGDLREALEEGVRRAYRNLRKSIVRDPLLRENTGDNTPPIVHYEIIAGNKVRIRVLLKGFGAELMSAVAMLPATAGKEGVKHFVLEVIERAGPNACPPVIVGVGLGGSFDSVAVLAKKALLRPLGTKNPKPHLAKLEDELLEAINALGIGPQGFGGRITALGVHVESYPTHIAALPIAVNLNCSAPRRAEVFL